ncbi:MAG: NusG domain II-containing protein [Clostridiales bacterium]|nr:NusG domain II-containing protein [Clostridiales bacterium]
MKKKDLILVIAILVIAGGALLGYQFLNKTPDQDTAKVVISVAGEEIGRYPLNKEAEIKIPAHYGDSILEIKDGHAKMLHAGCPDQICVYHNAISQAYDMIVCIPNQIIVSIDGGEEPATDSTAQ